MKAPASKQQAQFAEAVSLLRQGNIAAAEVLCLALLRRNPRYFDALHLAGLVAIQAGQHEEGIVRL